MERRLKGLVMILALFTAIMAILVLGQLIPECQNAYAEVGEETFDTEETVERLNEVALSIRELQPAHDEPTSIMLARWFLEAGEESDQPPKLLVATSMRESSLIHNAVGSVGEVGLMQIHGAALALRPPECSPDLESPRCQVRTGAAWLSFAKRICGESMSDYMFAYGVGRCPRSRSEAINHRSVKRVKGFYSRIGGVWQD